ncbi:transcriptional regulator [Pantoea rodasii]|uniref:Protein CopB n=1 Tax=Pantoea rodasii TaxID=1076549 RepID=A0A2M9W5R7_9GAMM|nr:replication regulatory protein RepA [Pantoea rodasii]PJZ02883.1 transcriptional regulator [Pantoea rodasii]
MSQSASSEASSSKSKRTYRKGNPLPPRERQKASLERRSDTHKALHAVILNSQKEKLETLASEEGLTQAQMLEIIIENEYKRRKLGT